MEYTEHKRVGLLALLLTLVSMSASYAVAEESTFSVLAMPESIAPGSPGVPIIEPAESPPNAAQQQLSTAASPSAGSEEVSVEAQQLELRPMTALGVSISAPDGKMPTDYAARQPVPANAGELILRTHAPLNYCWAASGSRHHPLYFEEVNAERYGYGCRPCFQPVVSAAHFFGTIPALPYLWMADCPRECVYTLGHYRPGSCNPYRPHSWPCKVDAAVVEGAAIAGLIFLLP